MSVFCTPLTTPTLALAAQDALLQYFLRRSTFQVKSTKEHGLNYVVVRRKPLQSGSLLHKDLDTKKKTLVLMHGYGLGLGFFFSEFELHSDFVCCVRLCSI